MLKNTTICDYLQNETVANTAIATFLLAEQTFKSSILSGIDIEARRLRKDGLEQYYLDGEIVLPVGYNQFEQNEESVDNQISQPSVLVFDLLTNNIDCGEFGTFPLLDFVTSYPEQAAELWLLLEQCD